LLVGGLLAVALTVGPALTASAVVIDSFVGPLQAAAGLGWAPHLDQTAGGAEGFVEGPSTPPSGHGSLALTTAADTDRALIFTVPKPGGGSPPPDIDAIVPTPWANLSGSFSTYITDDVSPFAIPGLRIVGYQVYDSANPALSTGFTTLNFEGYYQPTAPVANTWQTWTLGPTSMVWQSNTTGGICQPAAPCTLAQFAAQYPQGAWGPIQVGIGVGPVAATAYADNVQISDGTTTFAYDFEVPAASASTASITPGAATATGGSVSITLNSSPSAALGSTLFTITFAGTSAVSPAPVTLPAGQSATLTFDLPFGTTDVTVQAQGATLASAPITFQVPTTTTTTLATTTTTVAPTTTLATTTTVAPTTTRPATQLPATGPTRSVSAGVVFASLALGIGLVAILSSRRARKLN